MQLPAPQRVACACAPGRDIGAGGPAPKGVLLDLAGRRYGQTVERLLHRRQGVVLVARDLGRQPHGPFLARSSHAGQCGARRGAPARRLLRRVLGPGRSYAPGLRRRAQLRRGDPDAPLPRGLCPGPIRGQRRPAGAEVRDEPVLDGLVRRVLEEPDREQQGRHVVQRDQRAGVGGQCLRRRAVQADRRQRLGRLQEHVGQGREQGQQLPGDGRDDHHQRHGRIGQRRPVQDRPARVALPGSGPRAPGSGHAPRGGGEAQRGPVHDLLALRCADDRPGRRRPERAVRRLQPHPRGGEPLLVSNEGREHAVLRRPPAGSL